MDLGEAATRTVHDESWRRRRRKWLDDVGDGATVRAGCHESSGGVMNQAAAHGSSWRRAEPSWRCANRVATPNRISSSWRQRRPEKKSIYKEGKQVQVQQQFQQERKFNPNFISLYHIINNNYIYLRIGGLNIYIYMKEKKIQKYKMLDIYLTPSNYYLSS
jgi:hypothetical protein